MCYFHLFIRMSLLHSLGSYHQAAVGTYPRDTTVLQSIQGSAGADTPLWHHVSLGIDRPRTGYQSQSL